MMSPTAPAAVVSMRMDGLGIAGALLAAGSLERLGDPIHRAGEAKASQAIELAAALLADAHRGGTAVSGFALASANDALSTDLLGTMRTRFGLPAAGGRLMPAAMRGEQIRGSAQGRSSAVLFDTDRLAVGLVLNGRILRGAHDLAGNLAHTSIDATGGVRCGCGKVGCLVAMLATGPYGPVPALPDVLAPLPSRRHGWLALAAIHLINTLNPAVLILGGDLATTDADFSWLASAVERGCLAPARAGLGRITHAKPDNALIGAAAHFLKWPIIDARFSR